MQSIEVRYTGMKLIKLKLNLNYSTWPGFEAPSSLEDSPGTERDVSW